METYARPPEPLRNDGDMASNWQNWKDEFIIFMKVANYMELEPSDKRANCLKNLIGRVGIEAIRNITFDNEQDKDDMDILIEKLDKYFIPTKNEVFERYMFFTTLKMQNEPIEHYVQFLKQKAKNCNFKDMADSIIRDKIILDTQDKILRHKLFKEADLDLPKLIAIYNNYNTNTEKIKQFVHCCWRCGTQHPIRQCPAWGSKCNDCNELHHYTGRCPDLKKNKKSNDKANKNVFDETQKSTPKNDKWNIQPDPTVKKDSITFPEVATAPYDSDDENASADKEKSWSKGEVKLVSHHTARALLQKSFKPDETHTTNLKLQNDIMNRPANLPKKTEESWPKFPDKLVSNQTAHVLQKSFKPDETHTTNLKLQNNMNRPPILPKKTNLKLQTRLANLSKKTEDSHSHKNFTVKPGETHANSKLNDTTASHSANLFKSTLKQDETHNTNSGSWSCDNVMNHSANSSKNTQASQSYTSFMAKPEETILDRAKNTNIQKKKADDCVVS